LIATRNENDRLKKLAKLQEKEVKRLREQVDNQDELVERIAAESANVLPAPKLIVPGKKALVKGGHHRDFILPLFDLQFGQNVLRQDTPSGMNLYNEKEFLKRLARWLTASKNIIEAQSQAFIFDNLVLVQGGDMVEGDEIYPGMPWQLEFDPPQQVVRLCAHMSHAFRDLIAHAKKCGVKRVVVFNVPGNHGKVGGKRAGARPSTYSWDWIYFKMLEVALENQPIDLYVTEPAGSVYFESQGHTFLVVHGDEVKGWGGIPLYGLTRFDAKQIRLHDTIFDYLLLGHHHQSAQIEIGQGEHLMSGNWVGANNLTRYIGAAGIPSQTAYIVSRSHGVGARHKIPLTSRKESNAKPKIHELASGR
jgi:hypothetical protein